MGAAARKRTALATYEAAFRQVLARSFRGLALEPGNAEKPRRQTVSARSDRLDNDVFKAAQNTTASCQGTEPRKLLGVQKSYLREKSLVKLPADGRNYLD
jgi:hypothetical protein